MLHLSLSLSLSPLPTSFSLSPLPISMRVCVLMQWHHSLGMDAGDACFSLLPSALLNHATSDPCVRITLQRLQVKNTSLFTFLPLFFILSSSSSFLFLLSPLSLSSPSSSSKSSSLIFLVSLSPALPFSAFLSSTFPSRFLPLPLFFLPSSSRITT